MIFRSRTAMRASRARPIQSSAEARCLYWLAPEALHVSPFFPDVLPSAWNPRGAGSLTSTNHMENDMKDRIKYRDADGCWRDLDTHPGMVQMDTPGMHPRTLFCGIVCAAFVTAMIWVGIMLVEAMS